MVISKWSVGNVAWISLDDVTITLFHRVKAKSSTGAIEGTIRAGSIPVPVKAALPHGDGGCACGTGKPLLLLKTDFYRCP